MNICNNEYETQKLGQGNESGTEVTVTETIILEPSEIINKVREELI